MKTIIRTTKETKIGLTIGNARSVQCQNGMWQHLLTQVVNLAPEPLSVVIDGDEKIDMHHTLEDTGYVFGRYLAIKQELVTLKRFTSVYVPMDDALVRLVCDLSGRGRLVFEGFKGIDLWASGIYGTDISEFLMAFVSEAKVTLHVTCLAGHQAHHIYEALFKGLGLLLSDMLMQQVVMPSTKGKIKWECM